MLDTPQKPKSQNAVLDQLPLALAPLCQEPRWVLWRWELRKGKWTKPPYMANGANADSSDPTTWTDYATVIKALKTGRFDGIGFVLSGTTLAAIDLDDCLDENGVPDAWAWTWVNAANGTYIERTPSGVGLRIIGIRPGKDIQRRWKVDDARPDAGIEVYRNCNRYLTVTGAQIGDCAQLKVIDIAKVVKHYDELKVAKKKTKKATKPKGEKVDFNQAGGSIDYDDVIKNGAPEGQRSEMFQKVVWHLAAAGKSIDEIIAMLGQYPHGIGAKYVGRLREEVERSYAKWHEERQPGPAPDTEPDEPLHWQTVDKNGKPQPTCTNARRALRVFGIKCRYDVFHDKLLVEGSRVRRRDNLDHTVQILRTKIEKAYGFDPGTQNTHDAVIQLCLENEFDPVVDYINALTWDGVPRLDRWLITYTGAEDTELNREFGRIALIAAVRRARSPGCKFDPIIVLEGPMGTQKSKAIEVLAGVENFSDQCIFGVRDREQQELLAGVWVYEIAELSNIRKTEVEHIKAFASRTHDRARPAYGRTRVDQPRRCVLFATTNNDQYLKEADRRFWPVKTTSIDIPMLRQDRDQLWAEAAQREREGATIVLRHELRGAASVEQEAREEYDPWNDKLKNACGTVEQAEERISSADLLETVLGIHISKQRDVDYKRLGRCMRRLGWHGPKKTFIGKEHVKGYSRPVS